MKIYFSQLRCYLVFIVFLFLSIAGILSPWDYNILPASVFFEVLFFYLCLSVIKLDKLSSLFLLSILSVLYVAIKYVISIFVSPAYILDFIQAYKAFIYISLMFGISGVRFLSKEDFCFLYKTLILLFLIKYAYSVTLNFDELQGERPGIFTENNFELMILIIFQCALHMIDRKLARITFLLLLLVVLLSSSRSALLALLTSSVIIYFPKKYKDIVVYTFLLLSSIILMTIVFESRMTEEGLDSVDRIKLLNFFLIETEDWHVLNYIFGSKPLTELSFFTCSSLPFYDKLYSLSGQMKCYSVILHSYVLRSIFDHGIIGLVFLFFYVGKLVTFAGYSARISCSILVAIFSNGLSVSSFNSVYVMLPILLISSIALSRGDSNE